MKIIEIIFFIFFKKKIKFLLDKFINKKKKLKL